MKSAKILESNFFAGLMLMVLSAVMFGFARQIGIKLDTQHLNTVDQSYALAYFWAILMGVVAAILAVSAMMVWRWSWLWIALGIVGLLILVRILG